MNRIFIVLFSCLGLFFSCEGEEPLIKEQPRLLSASYPESLKGTHWEGSEVVNMSQIKQGSERLALEITSENSLMLYANCTIQKENEQLRVAYSYTYEKGVLKITNASSGVEIKRGSKWEIADDIIFDEIFLLADKELTDYFNDIKAGLIAFLHQKELLYKEEKLVLGTNATFTFVVKK